MRVLARGDEDGVTHLRDWCLRKHVLQRNVWLHVTVIFDPPNDRYPVVMAYIVMGYIVMAYIVMALYSYGRRSGPCHDMSL